MIYYFLIGTFKLFLLGRGTSLIFRLDFNLLILDLDIADNYLLSSTDEGLKWGGEFAILYSSFIWGELARLLGSCFSTLLIRFNLRFFRVYSFKSVTFTNIILDLLDLDSPIFILFSSISGNYYAPFSPRMGST